MIVPVQFSAVTTLVNKNRHISDFESAKWGECKDQLLEDILREKFTQKQNSKIFLLATGTKKLAEASFRDTYYGIGLSINTRDILTKKWSGNNYLGEVLMKIRNEVRHNIDN